MKENAQIKFTVVNNTDEQYEQNEENRMFAAQERANLLKEKFQEKKGEIESSKLFVEAELNKIKNEWPALYGKKSTKYFYVHVDLDSFYASVETLLNPKYKEIPLAVGSMNMIAACNYKAREYNVRAGMPGYHAKKLCPHLTITECKMERYNYYSELVMEILSSYDNDLESYGIDESCLVFTEEKLFNAYEYYNTNSINGRIKNEDGSFDELNYEGFTSEAVDKIVNKIREVIYRNLKLTVSAGISICRGVAKFASNYNKPNGQKVIDKDFDSFIVDLPIDKLNGIGKMTKLTLFKLFNIKTVKDLRNKYAECALVFQYKTFINLMRISQGLSVFDTERNQRSKGYKMKSIGNSYTIKSTIDYVEVVQHLWEISGQVWRRMERGGYFGNVVTLILKYRTFRQMTRQKKMASPVKTREILFETSIELLQPNLLIGKDHSRQLNEIVRMLGISVSNLYKKDKYLQIDDYEISKKELKLRECFICKYKFIQESDVTFKAHVKLCIRKEAKLEKEKKNKIFWYTKNTK